MAFFASRKAPQSAENDKTAGTKMHPAAISPRALPLFSSPAVYARLALMTEARNGAPGRPLFWPQERDMTEIAEIDRAIDGILVQLGQMVLRLSNAHSGTSAEERQALARSVNQFSVCAANSGDRRVQQLKAELEETLKPRLRLVSSR
jgi:hypothetical protein